MREPAMAARTPLNAAAARGASVAPRSPFRSSTPCPSALFSTGCAVCHAAKEFDRFTRAFVLSVSALSRFSSALCNSVRCSPSTIAAPRVTSAVPNDAPRCCIVATLCAIV